jgi:hypothetical protein
MTITVRASPGRQPASAMKAGSPIPGLLEVDQIFSARPIDPDQHRSPASCPRVAVRVTLGQVTTW